jgi:hypothetical protein
VLKRSSILREVNLFFSRYMVTEIGARNLGDTNRYNMLPVGYFSISTQNNYLRQCVHVSMYVYLFHSSDYCRKDWTEHKQQCVIMERQSFGRAESCCFVQLPGMRIIWNVYLTNSIKWNHHELGWTTLFATGRNPLGGQAPSLGKGGGVPFPDQNHLYHQLFPCTLRWGGFLTGSPKHCCP